MKLKRQKKAKLAEWKKVKLNGPVISDDGGDLAGFLGLEILEDYDKRLLKKEKKMKMPEVELTPSEKPIKEDKIKPEKKKSKIKENSKKVVREDSEEPEQPKAKKQKTESKTVEKENKPKVDEKHVPGKFVLLKPPKPKKKKKVKIGATKTVETNGKNEIPSDLYNVSTNSI